ncbi:MAG: DUF4212 domain-containing protein [Hyphomonadaceae bacterium]
MAEQGRTETARAQYWRANVRWMLGLLSIWFLVSFGAGILFREALDSVSIGGVPLGFWFAQQGAIYVFLLLIFIYCVVMNRLDKKLEQELGDE